MSALRPNAANKKLFDEDEPLSGIDLFEGFGMKAAFCVPARELAAGRLHNFSKTLLYPLRLSSLLTTRKFYS